MRRYTCPIGRMAELSHDHPERTARRAGVGIFADDVFQVWPNRASMAKSIRMQESSGTHNSWKAVVPLGITEGH